MTLAIARYYLEVAVLLAVGLGLLALARLLGKDVAGKDAGGKDAAGFPRFARARLDGARPCGRGGYCAGTVVGTW